jgi:uncharacterized protein with NAD-binding domain and iron-sulfur cluster
LIERGFDVTVYEALSVFGGKARSIDVPDTAQADRRPLPGEHGFRFFPGFYKHLTDTMERIPSTPSTAAGHLVDATRVLVALAGQQNQLIAPVQAPTSLGDLAVAIRFAARFALRFGVAPWDILIFGQRLLTLLASCDERRQAQFWKAIDLNGYGNDEVDGILSVNISEWERASKVTGKTAEQSTEKEILDEVWRQLADHIDDGSLRKDHVVARFLDPAVTPFDPTTSTAATNTEPLLINTANSWADRPDASTNLGNFFLASDFVRTHTDLATMEGANEAARRAVNGILNATDSSASRCQVRKLNEPLILAPPRALDRLCWELEQDKVRMGSTATHSLSLQ